LRRYLLLPARFDVVLCVRLEKARASWGGKLGNSVVLRRRNRLIQRPLSAPPSSQNARAGPATPPVLPRKSPPLRHNVAPARRKRVPKTKSHLNGAVERVRPTVNKPRHELASAGVLPARRWERRRSNSRGRVPRGTAGQPARLRRVWANKPRRRQQPRFREQLIPPRQKRKPSRLCNSMDPDAIAALAPPGPRRRRRKNP